MSIYERKGGVNLCRWEVGNPFWPSRDFLEKTVPVKWPRNERTLRTNALRQGLDAMTDDTDETRTCADCDGQFTLPAADLRVF